MHCIKCGVELPEVANFCLNCGTPTSKNNRKKIIYVLYLSRTSAGNNLVVKSNKKEITKSVYEDLMKKLKRPSKLSIRDESEYQIVSYSSIMAYDPQTLYETYDRLMDYVVSLGWKVLQPEKAVNYSESASEYSCAFSNEEYI